MKMEDHEADSRESAIDINPSLKPKFIPKGVTQEQLSKFQELQRRRLQIKSRSNIRKKMKDVTRNPQSKYLNDRNLENEAEHFKLSNSNIDFGEKSIQVQQDSTKALLPSKKLHKLHWGLDIKEPWERKANM